LKKAPQKLLFVFGHGRRNFWAHEQSIFFSLTTYDFKNWLINAKSEN